MLSMLVRTMMSSLHGWEPLLRCRESEVQFRKKRIKIKKKNLLDVWAEYVDNIPVTISRNELKVVRRKTGNNEIDF